MTGWLDVFISESVKLSCRMAGSLDWDYTWYKDGQEVPANDTISMDSMLTISSASIFHRGNYSCSGHLKTRSVRSPNSSELTLHVYGEIFFSYFSNFERTICLNVFINLNLLGVNIF